MTFNLRCDFNNRWTKRRNITYDIINRYRCDIIGTQEATKMSMFKGREKGLHIDYIFVFDEFKVNNVEIVRYNVNGRYPSDHYPLLAEINII